MLKVYGGSGESFQIVYTEMDDRGRVTVHGWPDDVDERASNLAKTIHAFVDAAEGKGV